MHQGVMRVKLLLCGVCFLAASAFADDLKMDAQPAFVGYGQLSGVLPLAVTMQNKGDDARGTLRVTCGNFQMDYPIELPHGTVKRMVAYPQIEMGDEVTLDLSTNQGNSHRIFRQITPGDMTAQRVLLVSENQGELSFMRLQGSGASSRMWDCYVKPAEVPDRAIAFSGLAAVVLGNGAERLSDGAVKALHLYVQSGGCVVFLGGAVAPALTDHRWDDVAPVSPRLPKTVAGSSLIGGIAPKTPLGSSFTIIGCEPHPSTSVRKEGGNVLLAKRYVGLGRTLCMTFNPLEPPFTRWPGKRALFEKVLRTIESARSMGYLQGFSASTDQDPYGSYYAGGYYGSSYTTPGYGYYESNGKADPFSTQLPPLSKVAGILAAYFFVIIPLNFLLLKKLKKGELAWFTAPLISVAFAGAFFAAAKELYSAKLSAATQGLLVACNDSPDTVFVGHSQLFFPQGGQYDLKIEGLESVGSSEPYDYYGYRPRSKGLEDVNPIDVGRVKIPRMDVNNLAFRELGYQQILPMGKWMQAQIVNTGGVNILKIKNVSRSKITSATAIVAGQGFVLAEDLDPGQSVSINLPDVVVPEVVNQQQQQSYGGYSYRQEVTRYTGLAELTATTHEIVIKGVVNGVTGVGPGIGDVVKTRQNIVLAYFTGLHYGKETL